MNNPPAPQSRRSHFMWQVVTIINLVLGVTLWFLYSTDFSLAGTVSDIVFPPIVGIIAFLSLPGVKNLPRRTQRIIHGLICLPSIAGAGLALLAGFLMVFPPFTLWTMFTLSEIANETYIQTAVSPDGARVAEVYFRGVGAYSGGNGRIFVRVKYRAFPLVE